MIARVPRPALVALRSIADHHLRAHGWDGEASATDAELDAMDIAHLLVEALAFVREAHPWIGLRGAVVEPPTPYPPELHGALVDAIRALAEPVSLDACIDALARALPFEVSDAPAAQRLASPRAYPFFPGSLPTALADVSCIDHVFGIIAEPGWIRDPPRRNAALRATLPGPYEELSFVELDGETAQRVACFLFAGPSDRASFKAYRSQAAAWVRLFGPGTRAFANRDFDGDELEDPFAHAPTYGWYHTDHRGEAYCAGGKALALVVTDGLRAASLDAIWETYSE